MSPGWRADEPEGWSWNTAEQDNGWPNQSAAGWGIGDVGWGVTETNVGDAKQVFAEPTAEKTPLGWGTDNGWGVPASVASNNQYKEAVERKTSISSNPISPKEEPRRSLTLDLHMPVR